MSKDLYSAPWSPDTFKAIKGEDVAAAEESTVVADEGREIVGKDGIPTAGYSAYGLCIKTRSNDVDVV